MKRMEETSQEKDSYDYEEVDMHSRNVTDITPILKVVASNPAVKRINLSDNYINELPADLSMLKEVYEINLIDNDLDHFEQAVMNLSTMPKLESLHLNLHEENQVDFVIRNLPNLRFLNGELIDREELQNESSRDDTYIPPTKKRESIKQIKEVDEEDDPSEVHNSIIQGIKSSVEPNKIPNSSYEEACNEILNYSDSEEISLKPQDLEAVALIFDKVRNLHRKNKLSNDKEMANEFDKHLKACMQKLSDIVTKSSTTTNSRNTAILKTKFELGEICHQKALEYCDAKDKNIGKIYSKTYQIHSEIISEYDRLYRSLAEKYYSFKSQNSDLTKQIESLKSDLQKANHEKAAVLEIGENIEKQMQAKLAETNKMQEDYKAQIQELKNKIKETEEENTNLFDKIIKHAKDRTDRVLAGSPYKAESRSNIGSERNNMNSIDKEELQSDKRSEYRSEHVSENLI